METNKSRFQKLLPGLKRSITHNSFLKVISLFAAFILWFTIVNYTNPEVTVTIKAPIEVRNAEELKRADRIYSLNEKSVNVSYKVRSRNRSMVKASDFTAYIDLADYSITGAVPVYIETSPSVSDIVSGVSNDPLIVHVNTETIIRRRFQVSGNVTGTASDGYVIGEMKCDPEVVYVTGTSSEVSKIASVFFNIEFNNEKTDVSGTEKIMLADADGKKLNADVKLEPSEYVNYTVKIHKTKSLTIKVPVEGLPADGYVVESVETSPTFVSVYGEDDDLNNTPYLIIPRNDINISGAAENKTFNLDINHYLPDGIFLNQGNSDLVVLVKIRSVMQLPEQNTVSQESTTIVTPTVPEPVTTAPEPSTEVETTETESSITKEEATVEVSGEDMTSEAYSEESSEETPAESTEVSEETSGTEITEPSTEESGESVDVH